MGPFLAEGYNLYNLGKGLLIKLCAKYQRPGPSGIGHEDFERLS